MPFSEAGFNGPETIIDNMAKEIDVFENGKYCSCVLFCTFMFIHLTINTIMNEN